MNNKELEYQTLLLSENDLGLAHKFCIEILKSNHFNDGVIKEGFQHIPLTISLIILYARPFTNNKGINRFPRKIINSLSKDQRETHEKFLDYRNKMIAHTDSDFYNAKMKFFNGGIYPAIQSPSFLLFGLNKLEIGNIESVIRFLLNKIHDREEPLRKELSA